MVSSKFFGMSQFLALKSTYQATNMQTQHFKYIEEKKVCLTKLGTGLNLKLYLKCKADLM